MRSGLMPSSVIRRFAYCPDSSELWVEFTTGRRYVYSGVPREVADTFRSAFAKGIYFNTRIRDRFPYREINHEGHQESATHS
ncbi:MAG TPA: KTSC domain-containing protein [Sphingomicrobium sp.]|nr:KTSC domain-containing protein [Sphingomicrobium sp.]